jgi:hypothetical protein
VRPLYIRTVTKLVFPPGHFRSIPAEVGSSAPVFGAIPPHPMEHPQEQSLTAGPALVPLEPSNDSTLPPTFHPVLQFEG